MNDMIELQSNLDKIERTVFRKYLYNVKNEFTVYPFEAYNSYKNSNNEDTIRFVYNTNIQCVYIERWVFDKKEQIIDRFSNVYSAFSQRNDAIALVIKRTCEGADFYFVVRTDSMSGANEQKTISTLKLLKEAVKGNFPGTVIKDINSTTDDKMVDIWNMKNQKAVSAITSISSDKSEKHISQGIEKLLNGVVPKDKSEEYTIVFLAEPIKHDELLSIKNGYESLASSVYSYGEFQSNYAFTETTSEGASWTSAHTTGTNRSIAKTTGINLGANASINTSAGWLKGIFTNIFKTKSATLGLNAGFQHSRTTTEGSQTSDTITDGINHCVSESQTKGETRTIKSYPIADMVKRIEKQIQRLDESEGVGMWKGAAYVLADNNIQAENVANFLLGILQGKDSFVEASVINTWSASSTGKGDDFRNILEYIRHFSHPILINIADICALEGASDIKISDLETITLANFVTSMELAYTMSFPYKSVKGLSCIECAEFERNVLYKNLDVFEPENNKGIEHREINLGQIYHMHEFENVSVSLDIDELTKHTFITGSTGSGKSTTIYKILHELNSEKYNIPFMVIEPAKGEYRFEFNNKAKIFTTNINHGELLQINPFYFPSNGDNRVFVSEHIDRLVEIFSACWPMYAAMPAVLKEALEASYEEAGWDLVMSKNQISQGLFPTFMDLLNQLKKVISNSDFSEEVKSNYTGSLVTRVKSLTNGIYRQIFTSKNTNENILFTNNVIIDISKVGSTETKALLMGILVMKMQEYHMANSNPVNQLKHITVIEEAHNLLRKTSTEQSSESANVLGKSVEMISNAIAEMRTYGEGFIIADQAPGLLDESVIRNTNTKIIMSLPDHSDRELVGKSVGLIDDQITEITRLPRGKAVIYQNNWVSPVLCAVESYKNEKKDYSLSPLTNGFEQNLLAVKENKLINAVLHNKIDDIKGIEENFILELDIPVSAKVLILTHRKSQKSFQKAERIDFIYDFYVTDQVKAAIKRSEIKLKSTINDDIEDLKSEYQHWIDVIGINNELSQNDMRAIINMILHKMQTLEQAPIEKCEQLFILSEKWR